MLRIRPEQIEALEQDAARRFEEEMLGHARVFSPTLSTILGDDQLRLAVRQAMARADGYGFTNRGPIRLYVEMMFLCGSDFDTDPQYPALGEILRDPGDQMDRAEGIHQGFLDYLDKVSGPGAVNVHRALEYLAAWARRPPEFVASSFASDMLREMARAYPRKAAYVGEPALVTLIDEGRAEAAKYGFPALRGEALIVILMFAFGHGCARDPLYPWISETLTDERIKDPKARAERLEKKAITWLDHVVARFQARSRA